MSCWHGYGARPCTWPYAYDPPLYGRPTMGYREPHQWDPDEKDLEEYLSELEAEVAEVRKDIEALRQSHARSRRRRGRRTGNARRDRRSTDDV